MHPDQKSPCQSDVLLSIKDALAAPAPPNGSSDFDLNADGPGKKRKFRPAAVLVPVFKNQDGLRLILTKRAAHLKHHPGQVSFPGGKVDASDTNAQAAAWREAFEEIGLSANEAQLLGHLPSHRTVTGFEVQPFVALVAQDFTPICNRAEVEEVFHVPLEHVLETRNYYIEGRTWMGKPRRYYVVPYGPYYIWGATARMLRMFAAMVELQNADHG